MCNYLREQKRDVLLLCAGWKGRYNLEDSLFAGAVVNELKGDFFNELSDSAHSADFLFRQSNGSLNDFLAISSHRRRLKNLNLEKDIEFCLHRDYTDVIPALVDGRLRALK